MILAERSVFAIAELAVAEHLFAACLAVFERAVAFELAASAVAIAMEPATAFTAFARACGRFVGHEAELGIVPADGHSGENVEDFLRECLGQFDGTEPVEELDAPDVAAADVAFAGDGANNVLRGYAVHAANAHVVAQESFFDSIAAFLALLAQAALFFAAEFALGFFGIAPEKVPATELLLAAFLRRIERGEFREQRLLFLVHLDDGRGDILGGHLAHGAVLEHRAVFHVAAFLDHRVDKRLELVEFAVAHDALHLVLESSDAFFANLFRSRHRHCLDRLAGGLFNRFQ